ncbi:MAG: RNA polymerase sigma factor [Candidatus Paceibacterota bacterium]
MADDTRSDDDLIKLCLDGDNDAFSVLVRRYINAIYNYSFRFGGIHVDHEDIVQETFIKVWKNLPKYNLGRSFKNWIFSIAHNVTLDYLRKKSSLTFSEVNDLKGDLTDNNIEDNIVDPEPLADEIFENKDGQRRLSEEIKSLRPIFREVLFLHYDQGLTFSEIAEILKISLNTAKSHHFRAINILHKKLSAPK